MVGDEVRLLEPQQDGLQDLVEVVGLERRGHEAAGPGPGSGPGVAVAVVGVLPAVPELLCAGELLAHLRLAQRPVERVVRVVERQEYILVIPVLLGPVAEDALVAIAVAVAVADAVAVAVRVRLRVDDDAKDAHQVDEGSLDEHVELVEVELEVDLVGVDLLLRLANPVQGGPVADFQERDLPFQAGYYLQKPR